MENKSPGGGLGSGGIITTTNTTNGGGLSFITSSSMTGAEKLGSVSASVMNGGSPDSTTPKDATSSSVREEMRNAAPSPAPSVSETSHGGGSAPNMYSLKWNTQLLSLQRSLANLWDSGIGTDAVLLCQGTPLPVHKIVLTAASPYVAAVVQTMAQGSHLMPVIVVDIPAEAGKALLSFLYCGEAHVPVTIIPHLVIGAKFLGISGFGDPGVLESLTSIVPESVMTPDKTPPPSCDSPRPDHDSPSIRLPHYQLPTMSVPHLMSSSSVQINNHTYGGKNKSERGEGGVHYPGNVLQFKTHQHLQAQISGLGKTRLPYPSPYSTSSTASTASSSGGEVINLSSNKNRTSSGSAYSPYSRSSVGGKSPKSTSSLSSGASSTGNGMYVGTTSILDNLLKNPRTHLEAAIAAAAAAAQNAANAGVNDNEANDNRDMVQYEAEGYLENCRDSPHNLTAAHLRQLQERQRKDHDRPSYYCSPGSAGHPSLVGSNDDDQIKMEMTMTEDSTPIPAHLLEPNVEYHIGSEYQDRYGLLHNPLADLAKVAAASMKHPATGASSKRGVKKTPPRQQQVDGNGEITSSDGTPVPTPPKKPKKNESIICEICNKKFSNAYNLRVHMEGHSGQVFVCSVCSHASRSRDALRKHFAYRHRELWISGMSAFRKNVPGRKISICRNNNNTDVMNNNIVKTEDGGDGTTTLDANGNTNTVVDANGNINDGNTEVDGNNSVVDANGKLNIRGDGSLTISEAK